MATLAINRELNGIEITFDAKPAQEIINTLKKSGFRWHNVKKLWYAKNTSERMEIAESITDGKTVTKKEKVASASLPSLWERCKTDRIPEHDRTADTKTVAAETRKHIKQRFPEIKFSCRIGAGGWAAANEVNFYFKSAPFAKDSIYYKAVKKYVKDWLWSFNYDNSDSMTDYFDRGFYETVTDWDFAETEPTESQKADLADFDAKYQEAKQEEERKQKEEYEKYLAEREAAQKAYEERQKIEAAQTTEINNHVKIVDIPEDEKYIISGSMICGMGKECDIDEIREKREEKEETAIIKRELHFTDETIYNNFCNMFLNDFDFLTGCGGTGTLDNRVSDDNFRKLNKSQRESVKWLLWDCVAVYFDGQLKLIIDPEGHSYSRYVNIVSENCVKTLLSGEKKKEEETEREPFYIPEPIAEQAQTVETPGDYTMIYVDSMLINATMHHIKITKKDVRKYAQYDKALYIEYVESGERKIKCNYFHDGTKILIYSGFLPAVPNEIIKKKINDNMYQVRNAGMSVNSFMIDVFKYYKKIGYMPEINTLQF